MADSLPQSFAAPAISAISTSAPPARRFRWQVIPGTLTGVFGIIYLLIGPAMAIDFWLDHNRGVELYAGADVPWWALYLILSTTVFGCTMLSASAAWLRRRNLQALLLTVLAIVVINVAFRHIHARFPWLN
jgi:hypothetical protein